MPARPFRPKALPRVNRIRQHLPVTSGRCLRATSSCLSIKESHAPMRLSDLNPTRRRAIRSLLGSSMLMPGLLSQMMAADDPMAPKAAHFPAKAKRVIFLYMTGGVSQVDSFDPKPQLTLDH